MAAVIAKYEAAGWKVFAAPRGTINDVIASNGQRMHFIQVIMPGTRESPRYSGLQRNTFIQNAFSNGALPVYATLADGGKISLEDINLQARVIVGGGRKERPAAPVAPPTAGPKKKPAAGNGKK